MKYVFGSLNLQTAFPLPSLPAASEPGKNSEILVNWAGVTIPNDVDWTHHWDSGGKVLLSLARQRDGYWLRVPDYADFLIHLQPGTVQVSPRARSLDVATLEHLLVDQILPRVLAQLGGTLVHASTVRVERRHVLFIGPSGWGKSTLAGLLYQRGHRVLSDDCVQIVAEPDGRFLAVPTYPSLRLNNDSLEAVFPEQTDTAAVASYSNKRRIPVEVQAGHHHSASTVDAVYLLGDPAEAGEEVRITPASSASICISLIKHSFRLDVTDRAATIQQLQQCSDIARAIPGFRLNYPRDHAQHEALVAALLGHIGTLPAPKESLDQA